MFDFMPMLQETAPAGVVLMPTAPRKTELPDIQASPDMPQIYEEVAALHYAALVALYGPAPDGVVVNCVYSGMGQPLTPHYAARFKCETDTAGAFWRDAFTTGLEGFAKAGFPDPVTVFGDLEKPGRFIVRVGDHDEVLRLACAGFARTGATDRLRRLVDHYGHRVPSWFDPDSPRYAGTV